MIAGIGIDVVEIDRIRGVVRRWPSFLERVFTPRERGALKRRAERMAVRWAAKEALLKALDAPRWGLTLGWKHIEVLNSDSGRPFFTLKGEWAKLVRSRHLRLHLSLSHDKERAVAFVVAERVPRSRGIASWGFKSVRRCKCGVEML